MSTDNRCAAFTNGGKGPQCTRMHKKDDIYCWQHSTTKILDKLKPSISQEQLIKYKSDMNSIIEIDDYKLYIDFDFMKNIDEAKYEALDFFKFNWNKNKPKIDKLNTFLGSKIYKLNPYFSNFIVISVGSSSTQSYYLDYGNKLITNYYEMGTNNFKESEFIKMIDDILNSQRHSLFINSIGFGINNSDEFMSLKSDILDLSSDISGNLILQIKSLLNTHNYLTHYNSIIVNSNVKPKFKNKWTNALAQELNYENHSYFVDYGGGKISISHIYNGKMDEDSIINFKYSQDPIVKYYKENNFEIQEELLQNKNKIIESIIIDIETNKYKQDIFNVIVRQTGKLREYYYM